jgi:hypothetical protein
LKEEKQMMQRQFERDESRAKWEQITIITNLLQNN